MSEYEDGFNAGIEAAAKVADYWGRGNWKLQSQGRLRFSVRDMQVSVNTAARGVAEDIRALRLCEDEAHVCLNRQSVYQAQSSLEG